MSSFGLSAAEFEKLQQAIKNFPGDAEKEINEVLHNEASLLIQDAIRRLMPVSGKKWKGKPLGAQEGNSLTDTKINLGIIVRTQKKYQYLYFPDDGTNTRKHAGNQQFFAKGGESQKEEIINRCMARLMNNFENQ